MLKDLISLWLAMTWDQPIGGSLGPHVDWWFGREAAQGDKEIAKPRGDHARSA